MAEDITHFGHIIWRNPAETDPEASFLIAIFHSAGKCYAKTGGKSTSSVTPEAIILTHPIGYVHGYKHGVRVMGVNQWLSGWI